MSSLEKSPQNSFITTPFWLVVFVFILLFAGVVGLALWSGGGLTKQKTPQEVKRGGYHEILQQEVQEFIDRSTTEKKANIIAVHFYDLNNDLGFEINEKEKFYPASFLKLPLMLAWFKEAEKNPLILDKKISYTIDLPQVNYFFRPAHEIKKGETYTINELISAMIKESDNNASNLLHLTIGNEKALGIFRELGIENPQPNDYLSVKKFATFYKVLFNASYLNKEFSERALQLLSSTSFKYGLRAGVPEEIAVSHKFAELKSDKAVYKQLHDCGIIYYPKNPYILCITTKGNDLNILAGIIQNISKLVYTKVVLAD